MYELNINYLAELLLNDDNGINIESWNYLKLFLPLSLISKVRCQDNRYYIEKVGLFNV